MRDVGFTEGAQILDWVDVGTAHYDRLRWKADIEGIWANRQHSVFQQKANMGWGIRTGHGFPHDSSATGLHIILAVGGNRSSARSELAVERCKADRNLSASDVYS